MTTDVEYALMAANVYESSRKEPNQIPRPAGWDRIIWMPDNASDPSLVLNSMGFAAGVFQRGDDSVISYTGTNQAVDWIANLLGGLGFPSSQLLRAAALYQQVKLDRPNANISFTGHSLGGGIAADLAVLFDKSAVVFDSAPFLLSAISPDVVSSLRQSIDDPDLNAYTNPFMYLSRSLGVRDVSTGGEILSLPPQIARINGGGQKYLINGGGISPVGLHDIVLLNAFLQNDVFRTATIALPSLLPEI